MSSSVMLRRVALVRTEVSEELRAPFIKVTRIGGLGTTLAVTSNRRTLRRNTKAFLHDYDVCDSVKGVTHLDWPRLSTKPLLYQLVS
jgi:hypothetical protein